MSYCSEEQTHYPDALMRQKKVMQELWKAESDRYFPDALQSGNDIKEALISSLTPGKKRSSSSLLRQKLMVTTG